MGETSVERSRAVDYHPAELVVALSHLDLVSVELARLSVVVRERARDNRLGLALLDLENLTESTVVGQAGPGFDQSTVLDLVLVELRERFMARFGGWIPKMGKNRVVHGVHGLEHISGGGAGDPHPEPAGPHRRPVAPAAGRTVPAAGAHPPGQARSARGDDARVGVLDTQIYPHDRLLGRFIAPSAALIDTDRSPAVFSPWAGHATFVSGLIVDRAPAAELEVRQVLSDADATASTWDVATEMVSFAEYDIDVLNLSFGCFTVDGQPPLLLARAVELLAPSMVLVAAAGNHGNVTPSPARPELTPRTPVWPAAFDDVVAVGAHDGSGQVAPFTPKDAPWIDLLAPGVDIRGDYLTGRVLIRPNGSPTSGAHEERFDGTAIWSGTSFAAAYVSGVVAGRTVRGRRSAHDARDELLRLAAGHSTEGIMPYRCWH